MGLIIRRLKYVTFTSVSFGSAVEVLHSEEKLDGTLIFLKINWHKWGLVWVKIVMKNAVCLLWRCPLSHSLFLSLAQYLILISFVFYAPDWCRISGFMRLYLLPRILGVFVCMASRVRRSKSTGTQCVALRQQMKGTGRLSVPLCTHQDMKLQANK